MAKAYTQEEFLEKAIKIHGDKIDFSNFIYKGSTVNGICKCNKCGRVWTPRADVILRGCGCDSCSKGNYQRLSFEEVSSRIRQTLKLSRDKYIDTKHKCETTCLVCGHVWTPRVNDLMNNHGCPECSKIIVGIKSSETKRKKFEQQNKNKQRKKEKIKTKEQQRIINALNFIKKSYSIHGRKYNYRKVINQYKNKNSEIQIYCNSHNVWFTTTPSSHLKVCGGCKECLDDKNKQNGESKKMTFEEWVEKCNVVHNGKYKYYKDKWNGLNKTTIINCPIHGDFEQVASNHLYGSGCLTCRNFTLENEVEKYLKNSKMIYMKEMPLLLFDKNNKQRLDFYIPSKKIAIECQGIQHFKPVDFGGKGEEYAKKQYEYVLKLDFRKKQICKEQGIKLVYFLENKYNEYMASDDTYFNNTNDLINYFNNF